MPDPAYQSGPKSPADSGLDERTESRRAARLFRAPWIDRDSVRDAFDRQHRRDEIGVRLHTLLAFGALVSATTTISATEIGMIPLIVYAIVRLNNTWRTTASLLLQPATLLSVALIAWAALSLAWSVDRGQGLWELAMVRAICVPMILWPVIEHRRWLIAALAIGFGAGNLLQIGHALGERSGIEWLQWARFPGRNSIWWHPVVGGTVLTAALGLHLPVALMGRGRWRLIGAAGAALAAFGVIATGSRGSWLAATTLIALAVVVAGVRAARARRVSLRAWGIGLIVAGVVALGGWLLAGQTVVSRVDAARTEIERAVVDGDYSTDTGARILMAIWAGREIGARPLGGVGLGGYQEWAHARLTEAGADLSTHPIHDHAHNAYLHLGATTGIVGLALGLGVLVFAVVGGFTRGGLGAWRPVDLGSYDAGPAFALIGVALASNFDASYLSIQSLALLMILLTLCPSVRPAEWGKARRREVGAAR